MSSRILSEFDLLLPQSVDEALSLLDQYGDQLSVLAGGTDLLIALKFGDKTSYAMSISGLSGLDCLEYDPSSGLRIGAQVTLAQLLASDEVKTHYPSLWQSAKIFATPQLRNVATIVGNVMRASPAGDCSAVVYAQGADVVLRSVNGERAVSIDDFFTGYAETARQPNELATELRLPAVGTGSRQAFRRLTRVNEDLAKLNVAVNLTMDGDLCQSARLVMGCVGPTLLRLPSCEQLMVGQKLNGSVLQTVMAAVQNDISPIDDKRSTAAYRRQVAGVYLRRAIEQALDHGQV